MDCNSDFDQKLNELQKVKSQVDTMSAHLDAREKGLSMRESLARQQQTPNANARDLEFNMRNNMAALAPGNVGDINKIIWPYWFSTPAPATPIGAGQNFQTSFSITQEAAFIMMSFTKAVYKVNPDNANAWEFLDPNNLNAPIYQAPGLAFTIRDSSSSRQFFNTPIPLSNYGNQRFPSKFPRPLLFLPRQQVQVAFYNQLTNANVSYVPFITFFGYRMRIEDAQALKGLVYA